MSGVGKEIVLSVQDLGVVMESLSEAHPALAHKIPPKVSAVIGRISSLPGGERTVRLVQIARRMRIATLGFLVIGIVLCVVAVWLSAERRMAILRTGFALALLGLLLAIIARFGGTAVGMLARNSANDPALAALARAFLDGLLEWGIGLGASGLVLASASASFLERVPLGRWREAIWSWMFGPQERMRMRLLRGLVGTAVGAAFLIAPLASLTVTVWLAGLVAAFAGLREAFVAALHLLPEIETEQLHQARHRATRRGAMLFAGGLALVLLAGITWWIVRAGATPPEDDVVTACNGSPALCDRTLDQVVIPSSHNSMGGAGVPGWMFPNQDADIQKQLADGVRGFLIDVHYGVPIGDRVKTELSDEVNSMAKYKEVVGEEGVQAALRMRDRMTGQPTGERDVYMCHGFCELGSLPLVPVLKDVRDFLVANPGEVLVFVIQDEGVKPQDVASCFERSGLIDFVYKGPAAAPWPTLREMVESDQRVLVMAENDTSGVAWYYPAFRVMQETPYAFHEPSEFTNRPNRGGTGGSLMLLNHWIETTPLPKPSNAAIVNAHDALMKRILDFRRERGRLPNLVAVDFYATGDMLQVVRELNEQPLAAARGGGRNRKPAGD